MDVADAVVIGAGIAGASTAWALADELDVVLLDAEPAPGMHATGRSAALLTETTGPPAVRALTATSRTFLEEPPDGFTEHPLTRSRGLLWIAGATDAEVLRASADGMEVLDGDGARGLVPLLRPSAVAVAAYEAGALDLDVDGLLQGYLRGLRARGGTVHAGAPVTAMRRVGERWEVTTPKRTIAAAVVVDAAGAWADAVATLAGARPVGLRPLRRTTFTFAPPSGIEIERWPMVVEVLEAFYVKPDAGRLLGSPADETPSDPCDARAEETDVALAVERIEAALDLEVRGVRAPWAGLRTFAPDRVPVVGPDPDVPAFLWCAGQGGYGIKTSPALAAVVAHHVLGSAWPAVLIERGVTPIDLSPGRLQQLP